MRSGFATVAADSGQMKSIMAMTGHKTTQMVRRYIEANIFKNNALNKVKLWKKILIIGCGYWGTIVINCIKNLKKFREIYICDEDPEKIKKIKKRFGNFVKNIKLKDISNNKDIKFIYLATPPSKNLKLISKILPLNRNILLEKPGFSKLNEFKIVKKKLKKTKSKLRFGYIYLYHNYIKLLKKLINQKSFGKIKYIKFQSKILDQLETTLIPLQIWLLMIYVY